MNAPRPAFARGFSLVEVMFAIVILATALTMTAGAIYFGIGQTVATSDESVAAETARSAANVLERVMTLADTPSTGRGFSPMDTSAALSNAVRGAQISVADPRYAWVGLYQRDDKSRLATVYVIVVKAQTGGRFVADDSQSFDNTGTFPPALAPRGVDIQLTDGGPGGVDRVTLAGPAADAAAPDAYVVITSPGASGETAGRIYRLGNVIDPATHTFALAPGADLRGPADNLIGTAALVGRPYRDRTQPTQGFDGLAQDVAIYRLFVSLK